MTTTTLMDALAAVRASDRAREAGHCSVALALSREAEVLARSARDEAEATAARATELVDQAMRRSGELVDMPARLVPVVRDDGEVEWAVVEDDAPEAVPELIEDEVSLRVDLLQVTSISSVRAFGSRKAWKVGR